MKGPSKVTKQAATIHMIAKTANTTNRYNGLKAAPRSGFFASTNHIPPAKTIVKDAKTTV